MSEAPFSESKEADQALDAINEELTDQQQQELESKSEPFVGKWNKLISTTNWEKGSIIVNWQSALEKAGLPKNSYSDERWSQLCGGATPQHIGRLRRTYSRFGHVYKQYEGLHWSHFFAALDWEDAEMWLEGAIQNTWSVSKMRNARWETMGKRPEDKPRVDQIVVTELDEENQSISAAVSDGEYAEGPRAEDPDFGDSDSAASKRGSKDSAGDEFVSAVNEATGPKIRPFESFDDLPEDIQSAANAFKIAIIKHKADQWNEISLEDLHGLLDALKSLAIAASE